MLQGGHKRLTDRQTDGQTDSQTGWIQYTPPNFVAGGINGKNPSWSVDATGRTRKVNGQTDRQTDRQTGWIQYTPPNFVARGIIIGTPVIWHTIMLIMTFQFMLMGYILAWYWPSASDQVQDMHVECSWIGLNKHKHFHSNFTEI